MTTIAAERETYAGGNYSVTAATTLVRLPRGQGMKYAREHGRPGVPWGERKWGWNYYLRFLDLMELRIAKESANMGVPWTKIRRTAAYAARRFDLKYPLSSKKFLTDGYEVIFREHGLIELMSRNGHTLSRK